MIKSDGHLKDEIGVSIKYKLVSIVSILIIITVSIIIIIATFLFRTDNETRIKENNHMLSKTIALKTRSDLESTLAKLKTIDLIEMSSQDVGYQNRIIKNLYFSKDSDLIFIGTAKKIANNFVFKDLYYNDDYLENSSLSKASIMTTSQKYKDRYESVFKGATLVFNASVDLSEPVICIINPYKTINQKVTLIHVTFLKINRFQKIFESSGDITEIFMVSSNGDIIGHSNTDLVRIGANLINSPIIEMMKKSPLNNGHLRYQKEDGKYYLGSFHRTGFAGIVIVAISDEQKVLKTVYNMQRLTVYVTIIVLAMAIIIVFIIGNGITAPIQKVVEAVRKIENGIFNVDIQAQSRDEIGLLTRSVVQMGKGLEEREKIKNEFDQLSELDKLKTDFFTNISHEIRTPLTLILSPVESVLQGDYKKEVDKDFLKNIQNNAVRLLRLVNNILDFSKIEKGKMQMTVQEVDIVKNIKKYIKTLGPSAESKDIDLSLETDIDSLLLYIDGGKADKIAMNLFSNALKFTENGGKITIRLREDDDNFYIQVEDTGIGIPENMLDSIFERFNQVDGSSSRKYEGTGIGLPLAKELAEMHSGSITVQSKHINEYPDDHGSIFTVRFPKGKKHFENIPGVKFIIESEVEESLKDRKIHYGLREMVDYKYTEFEIQDVKIQTKDKADDQIRAEILVVEDNSYMRDFLKTLLENFYTIHFAVDGLDGIEKATELNPDLIITDVMMPNMDGYQMTRTLKEDEHLKRIPVLMLTAQSEIAHKIEGLEYGVDDYVTKPFNSRELLVRLKNLLEKREYVRVIEEWKDNLQEELETARLLQHKLLPEKIPHIPGYKSHVTYLPMEEVGGDFYDFKKNEEIIELLIADVSGHGLSGAFLSMIAKMAFESIVQRKSPAKVLSLINNVICRSTVKNKFITAFYGHLDINTNILTYSNAGHFPPMVYRRKTNEFFKLKTKGILLGWSNVFDIREKTIKLDPGDRIFLYTDGIIECNDSNREDFGEERFMEYIRSNSNLAPETFSDEFIKHLKEYSGKEKFDDDLCLVVVDIL